MQIFPIGGILAQQQFFLLRNSWSHCPIEDTFEKLFIVII